MSLFTAAKASAANPRNISEALAAHEREAAAVLAALGYEVKDAAEILRDPVFIRVSRKEMTAWKRGDKDAINAIDRKLAAADAATAKRWPAAMHEPAHSPAQRAAKVLFAISECRRALAARDAEGAAWAVYVLAAIDAQDSLDAFEKPIRHGAKLHAARRENEGPGLAAGIEAAAVLARAANPRGTAKKLWRWIVREVMAGRLAVPSFKFEVNGDEVTCDELAQIDAKKKRRAVSLKTFANEYTPPKRD